MSPPRRAGASRLAAFALAMMAGGVPAGSPALQAQASRQEELRRQREAKAEELRPYVPRALERYLVRIEDERLLERLFAGTDRGLFPFVRFLEAGRGLGLGGGYRNRLLLDRLAHVEVVAAGSVQHAWLVQAHLSFPRLARGRAFAGLQVEKMASGEENFFGVGPRSRRSDFVSYTLRDTSVGGTAGLHLGPRVTVGGGLARSNPSLGRGRQEGIPSIERLFTDETAPGLAEAPDMLHSQVFVDVNAREPRGNPRVGGEYRLAYHRFADRELGRFSFGRVELDAQQYVPFLNGRRVVALRGYLVASGTESGQRIPFYLQTALGGSHALRGFRSLRFRDRHAVLLQTEYRWEVFPALDAALFLDAGKVASRRADLDLRHLETAYGFGLRFGTRAGVFLRLDASLGGSGDRHFFLRFNHAF